MEGYDDAKIATFLNGHNALHSIYNWEAVT
jgi:hypothetical protein